MENEPLHLRTQHREEPVSSEDGDGLKSGPTDPGTDTKSGLDMNYVLAQYGQAMARVGQLESRISALVQQVDSQSSAGVSEVEKDRLTIDELKDRLASKDESITSLNSYIAALSQELMEAKRQLDGRGRDRGWRRSRRHHRKWWQFWREHHRR